MENAASHPASCISPTASMSAGESSWAMHFAEFLASPAPGNQGDMDPQGGVRVVDTSFSSDYSSSFASLGFGSGYGSCIVTDDLMDDADEVVEEDSLQDTACSSAAGYKVTNINDDNMKPMKTMDTKEMDTSQLAKYLLDACSRQQTTGAVQEVISGGNGDEKQLHECNDLRKKGFCLVPFSMLIDYLG